MNFLVLLFTHAHAEHFCQHQGHDAVPVHSGTIGSPEIPLIVHPIIVEHKRQRSPHGLPLGCGISGQVPGGGKSHDGQRRHGGVVPLIVDRTGLFLDRQQILNPFLDASIHFVFGKHPNRACLVRLAPSDDRRDHKQR